FDFDVHACREIELRQRIDRLRPRIEDVDQPFMGLELELLAALLVDVRAPQYGPELPLCWQRDRPRDLRTSLFGRAHDVRRSLIDLGVVESFLSYVNFALHLVLVNLV